MVKQIGGKKYRFPDDISQEDLAKAIASIKNQNQVETVEVDTVEALPLDQTLIEETEQAEQPLLNDAINVLAELSAGTNRSILQTIDFLGPDTVNAILSTTGSEYRLPQLMELANDYGIHGGFMDKGLARDAIRTAGETIPLAAGIQSAVRKVPDSAPEFIEASKNIPNLSAKALDYIKRLPKNLQASIGTLFNTAKNETALSAGAFGGLAGAGGEIGADLGGSTGQFIGEIAAPTLGVGTGAIAKKAFSNFFDPSMPVNHFQDRANEYINHQVSDRITRTGIPSEKIPQHLEEISPVAVLADIDETTQRTLREKMNESDIFHAEANRFLNQRHEGRIGRIKEASLSDGHSADIDNAIENLRAQTQPAISELYREAEKMPMPLTPWLKKAILGQGGDSDRIGLNSVHKLQGDVEERLANYELLGKPITQFSVVNETKKVLDDKISQQLNSTKSAAVNEIRQLVALKNRLLDEADKMNPYYPQARELFAGRAALENAADMGRMIFKTSKSDLLKQTQHMSQSEKDFYHMGARQAILDKIDNSVDSGNLARKLFNRVGDEEKIATLFNSEQELKRYLKVLEAEYALAKTKNAAQGNSTSAPQLKDLFESNKELSGIVQSSIETGTDLATGNLPSLFTKISSLGKYFKKDMPNLKEVEASDEFKNARYEVGKIMLMRGDDLKNVLDIVENANAKKLYTVVNTLERDKNKIHERINKVYRLAISPQLYSESARQMNDNQSSSAGYRHSQ